MWLQQGAQQPQPSNGTAGVLQQPTGAYGGNTFGTGQPTAAASPFVMAPQQHHHHQQYHPHASNAPPQNYPQAGYYATAPPGATQPQMIYAGAPGQPNFSAMPTTANATASSPYHVLPQQSAYPAPGATATQPGYYAAAPGPHHHHHQPQYVAMTHSPTSGNNNAAHTTFVSHAGHHMSAQAGMLPPQQYYVAQPTPQQQQQQANPHMQPQPTSQPQVVYLPNGQFAVVLQPPPGSSAPSPSNMMSTSYPSPARVGPPGANGSLTVLPSGSSGGMTPTNIVVAGSSQSQLTMPMFVSPSVGNPPLEPGSGAGSPGGSTSRTPAQLGASLHNASSSATRPQSDPAQWGYAVVDPYHTALQRVPVPPSVVQPTRGTQTYNNDVSLSSTKPCTSHVCLRYITPAGCPLGENCASFHVAGTYIDISRGTTDPLCCGLHNDYFTQEMMRAGCAPHMPDSKFTLVLDDRSEVELLPAQLAFTVGLEQLSIRGNSRIIHIRKQVCRLHLDGRCKWTKDCGHVHLCRELHRLLSTFHYPSLVFLLSTETDDEKLSLKLNEVKEFIRSRSCMPLTHQLINTKRAAAVAAMCRVGALFTPEMALAAESQCGIQVPAEMVIAPTDFAVEAIHPERRAKYNHQAVAPSAVPTPTTTGPSGPTAPMLQLDVLAADAPRTSHSQHGAIGDLGYSASPNA